MNYSDKNVKCPFFVSSRQPRVIKCEGIISEQCQNEFSTDFNRRAHFEKYCCGDYKNCPIAKIIIKKYDFEVT